MDEFDALFGEDTGNASRTSSSKESICARSNDLPASSPKVIILKTVQMLLLLLDDQGPGALAN